MRFVRAFGWVAVLCGVPLAWAHAQPSTSPEVEPDEAPREVMTNANVQADEEPIDDGTNIESPPGSSVEKTQDAAVPLTTADDALRAEQTATLPAQVDPATVQIDGVATEVAEQLELAVEEPAETTERSAIPVGPPPKRETFVQGGAATVMLAATLDDRRQGTLEPLRGRDGRVVSWKVRASDARDFFGVCEDDPTSATFAEPTVGLCTGVVLGPDLVLTAGHCIDAVDDVATLRVVLDYTQAIETRSDVLPADKVFSVVLDSRGRDDVQDWALLRVVGGSFPERVAPLCRPLDLCEAKQGVWSIGHPLGVSRRYLAHHRVVRRTKDHLLTDLDTYVGSSGSPVYDRAAGRVLGIVVSGQPDFVPTTRGCRRFSHAHSNAAIRTGEVVLRVDALPASVLSRVLQWQSKSRRVISTESTRRRGRR